MLAERLSNLTIVESKAKALYDEARLMNEFDRALRARNNAVEDVVTAMKWNLNESVSAAATGQRKPPFAFVGSLLLRHSLTNTLTSGV